MRINSVPTVREILYQDIKGASQRGIAQSLGISRTTIQKYCNLAKSFGYSKIISDEKLEEISLQVHTELYQKGSQRHQAAMLLIAPHHDRIKVLLNDPWITHKQIHRLFKEDGIHTSPRSISRYIEQHFPKEVKSTVHLLTTAGEEAQVDYGYVGLVDNKKTYAFVITLSHSRYRYVEFVHSQNIQSWVQSHINAFTFFGAVPRTIILDNLKSGVISADIYDPTLNKTYSELATHYGFIADPAKASKPEHKGKVERSVRIVK
jgi:transposase